MMSAPGRPRLKAFFTDAVFWTTVGFFLLFFALAYIADTQLRLVHKSNGKVTANGRHYGLWALVLMAVLILLAVAAIGFASKSHRFDGVLIDRYNRITLAHFQMLLWTVLVLSAFSAVVLTNLMAGSKAINALDVSIPPELWLAMGVSGTSLATSKLIKLKIPDTKIASKKDSVDARWIDMFRSDLRPDTDVTNQAATNQAATNQAATNQAIDLSKVQMFFFSVVLVAGYAVAVADQLANATERIGALPALNDAFILLLLVSNGTYLARKGTHLVNNETGTS
jgi:hypothetical protein